MTDFLYEGTSGTANPTGDHVFTARVGVLQDAGDLDAKFHIDSGSAAEMMKLENDNSGFQFNVEGTDIFEIKNLASNAMILKLGANTAGVSKLILDAVGATSDSIIDFTLSGVNGGRIWFEHDNNTFNISRANTPETAALTINTAGDLSLNSRLITNILDPVSAQDAATKNYVDTLANVLTIDNAGASSTTVNVESQTFSIGGGTGIDTTTTAQALTVSLANTAVSAGTYGAGISIPRITVDAQGRITALSLDQLTATSGDFSIGDDLTLGSDAAAIVMGATNQVTLAHEPNTLKLTGSLEVTGDVTIAGDLTFGDFPTDTVSFDAKIDSDFLPATTNYWNLGTSGYKWKDLHLNGTATIGTLNTANAVITGGTFTNVAISSGSSINGLAIGNITPSTGAFSSVDINGGAIDGTTVGSGTPATGAFTTLSTTGLATLESLNITNETTANASIVLAGGKIDSIADYIEIDVNSGKSGILSVDNTAVMDWKSDRVATSAGVNVGIGTVPDRPLHIKMQGSPNHMIRLEGVGENAHFGFEFEDPTHGVEADLRWDGNVNKMVFGTGAPPATAKADRMWLDRDGNLGIGTENPNQPFEISNSDDNADVRLRLSLNPADLNKRWDMGIIGTGGGDQDARLAFEYEGSDKLTILQGGRVGIGTTDPYDLLHVADPADDSFPTIKISGGSAQNSGKLVFGDGTSINDYLGIYRGQKGSVTTGGDALNIGGYSYIAFEVSESTLGSQIERMCIVGSTGNVGIGVDDPDNVLEISSARNGTYGPTTAQNADGTTLRIVNRDTTNINSYSAVQFENNGTGNAAFARIASVSEVDNSANLMFCVDNAGTMQEALRMDRDGNIGIGVIPTKKFHVVENGNDAIALFQSTNNNAGWIEITDDDSSAVSAFVGVDSDNGIAFLAATGPVSNNMFVINASGDAGISQLAPVSANSTAKFLHIGDNLDASSGLVLENDTTKWEIKNEDSLEFYYGTSKRAYINTAGSLYADIVIPSDQAAVAGALRISSGDLQYYDGSSWEVAVADGSSSTSSFWAQGAADVLSYIAGDVGVGLAAPLYPLHVKTGNNSVVKFESDDPVARILLSDSTNTVKFETTSAGLGIHADNSDQHMTILTSGNVGIGEAVPATALDIQYATPSPTMLSITPADLQDLGLLVEDTSLDNVAGETVAGITLGYTGESTCAMIAVDEGSGGKAGLGFVTGQASGTAEAIRINHAGNVGIGTDNPDRPLHIKMQGDPNHMIRLEGSGQYGYFGFEFEDPVDGVEGRFYYDTNANKMIFGTGSGSVSDKMWLDSSGNLGIGTDDPDALLHLERAGTVSLLVSSNDAIMSRILFGDNAGDYQGHISYDHTDDSLSLYTNTAQQMTIDNSGNVGIGVSSPTAALHVETTVEDEWAMKVRNTNDTGSNGIYLTAGNDASDMALQVLDEAAATEYFAIRGDGNVGIGTANPGSELDVGGGYMANEQGRQNHVASTSNSSYYYFPHLSVMEINKGSNTTLIGKGSPCAHLHHQEHSVSAWFKTDSTDVFIYETGQQAGSFGGPAGPGLEVLSSSGYLSWFAGYDTAAYKSVVSEKNYADDKWHHVVGTDDGTNITIYVDGILEGTEALTAYTGMVDIDQEGLGGGFQNGDILHSLRGGLSDIKFFNIALSADEVKELYSGNNVSDKYEGAASKEWINNGTDWTDAGSNDVPDEWSITTGYSNTVLTIQSAANGFTGNHLKITGTSGPRAIRTVVPGMIKSGKKYRVSFKYRSDNDGGSNYLYQGVSSALINLPDQTDDAELYTIDFIAADDIDWLQWYITAGSGSSAYLEIDEVSVVQLGCIADYNSNSMASSHWNDVSGNNNHATAIQESTEPVYLLNQSSLAVAGASDFDANSQYILNDQGHQNAIANMMSSPYYHFDGVIDQINFSTPLSLPDDFSLSLWIYPEGGSDNDDDIIDNHTLFGDAANNDWIRLSTANLITIETNGNQAAFDPGVTFTINEWQHIVIIRSTGGLLTVYRNGIVGQEPGGSAEGTFSPDYIGQKNNSDFFRGSMSSIRVYNLALTAADVKELYSGASVPFKYQMEDAPVLGEMLDEPNFDNQGDWVGGGSATQPTIGAGKVTFTEGGSVSQNGHSIVKGKAYRHEFEILTNEDYGLYGLKHLMQATGDMESDWIKDVGVHVAELIGVNTSTNGYVYAAYTNDLQFKGTIDNASAKRIGCIAEYDGSSAGQGQWMDKSGFANHGLIQGASLQNQPVYQPVGQNLITNSGFDVWSQSGGPYVVIGGEFADSDALRNISNTDYTTYGSLVVNGGFDSDATGWTEGSNVDVTIANSETSDVINPHGNNIVIESEADAEAHVYQTITGLKVGRLYQFAAYVRLGNNAGARVYAGTGGAKSDEYVMQQFSNTGDWDASIWTYGVWTFEATSTSFTVSLSQVDGTTGKYCYFDSISLYEIVPGTKATTTAMDGWIKAGTNTNLFRSQEVALDGSEYILKNNTIGVSQSFEFPGASMFSNEAWVNRFQGRTVTFGMWVYASTGIEGDDIQITAGDNLTRQYSNFHSGIARWEWLEVTHKVASNASQFSLIIYPNLSGTATTTSYYGQPMLVFGDHIGEGNYSRPAGEIVICEEQIPIITNESPLSTDDKILDLEVLTDGKIPKGCAAIEVWGQVKNSSITDGHGINYGATSTADNWDLYNIPSVNAITSYVNGTINCDTNGDIYQRISEADDTLTTQHLAANAIKLK